MVKYSKPKIQQPIEKKIIIIIIAVTLDVRMHIKIRSYIKYGYNFCNDKRNSSEVTETLMANSTVR